MSHYIPTPLTAASARCPHPLLDHMLEHFRLKNDAALARALHIAPPRISKIRRGHMRVSPDLLLRMHEAAQIPVAELRRLLDGVQRPVPPPRRGQAASRAD
ncbi:MAG: helix-turn-helix domain-containing protein [Pseudomonadota bacterium]